jgi:hypothetical protein
MTLTGLVIYGVVAATGFAAFAWLRSATAKVPAPAGAPAEGFQEIMSDDGSIQVNLDGVDLVRTMALQSKWNRIAAGSACIAAALQALQTWLTP